jgi:hypothetical protein
MFGVRHQPPLLAVDGEQRPLAFVMESSFEDIFSRWKHSQKYKCRMTLMHEELDLNQAVDVFWFYFGSLCPA